MPRIPSRQPLPDAVRARLASLGATIRAARLRRRWSQALLAEKAGIAVMTLRNAERGHPGVTLATYVVLLWALNLDRLLEGITDPAADREGLAMAAARSDQRAYPRRELDDAF